MEAGVGVNSPEFLQKKIERLKTALEEANVLMDRQVTERDEARAQLDVVRRENAELKEQLEQGGAAAPEAAEAAPAIDPELEKELRDRIAQLEGERASLQSDRPDDEADLRDRIQSLQGELDAARRELDTAAATSTPPGRRQTARATTPTLRAAKLSPRGRRWPRCPAAPSRPRTSTRAPARTSPRRDRSCRRKSS